MDQDRRSRMVMRDLATNVVQHVRLGDTMSSVRSNPSHDCATVTHEASIERSQSAAGECKLGRTVVRENGICMVQERDQHHPVIDPEIMNE